VVVDALRQEDLQELAWAGGALHVKNVAGQLKRVLLGEVDYLAVRDDDRRVVAKGGVDYASLPGVPKLWQLATHPDLRGLGFGTLLIRSLEDRVRQRGFGWAHLGVEVSNPRAMALYRRLGYEAYGRESDGWEQQDGNGDVYWYETELIVMKRPL
jgi:ribosomal protein S18 acetylase RimI-like enzyme